MMPTEDTLLLLVCTIDDGLHAHRVPRRPGPTPAGSDSERRSFALAGERRSCPSEHRCLRELSHNWRHRCERAGNSRVWSSIYPHHAPERVGDGG